MNQWNGICLCLVNNLRLLSKSFDYFRKLVESNPDDHKSKAEMNKALQLSQDSNDKVVRILDMMLKMTQTEMKTSPKAETSDTLTFESLRNNGKK